MSIKATPDFCRSWFVLNNSDYPGLDPSSFSCQILLWAGLLGIPTSEILSIWKIQWPESLCWPLEGALSSHIRAMALCWAAHHFLMLSWIKTHQLYTLNSLGNAQCPVCMHWWNHTLSMIERLGGKEALMDSRWHDGSFRKDAHRSKVHPCSSRQLSRLPKMLTCHLFLIAFLAGAPVHSPFFRKIRNLYLNQLLSLKDYCWVLPSESWV